MKNQYQALDPQPVVQVTPAQATSFRVSGLSGATAGNAQTMTVSALDAFGNVVTGFRSTASFSSSDGRAVLPGPYTFTSADAGTHTFTGGVTLKTAGSQNVTATSGASVGSQSVSITAAGTSKLALTGLSDAKAGVAQTATVTAYDPYGNTATGFVGRVSFTSTDDQASLPGPYTFSSTDAGTHTFAGAVTLKTAGSEKVTATSGSFVEFQSVSITAADASELALTGLADAKAGVAQTATVTVYDPYGNRATGFRGQVMFEAPFDRQPSLPGPYTFTSTDAGRHTFPAGVTLRHAGSQEVFAESGSLFGSEEITITPAEASTLELTGLADAKAGVAQTATVTAYDPYGNAATGFVGKVTFTSSDNNASLPGQYTFTSTDAGRHTFTGAVTLKTTPSQGVTVSSGALSSSTQSPSVYPAGAYSLGVTGLADASADTAQSVTVTVFDRYGNVETDYTGQVGFTVTALESSGGGPPITPPGLPEPYTFTSSDHGRHVFPDIVLTEAVEQRVTVTDRSNSSITGSETVAISPGAAESLVLSGLVDATAGASQSATVTAYDFFGNRVTDYRGEVGFILGGPPPANTAAQDQSTIPHPYTFTSGDQGQHVFTGISLTTAGVQTLGVYDTAGRPPIPDNLSVTISSGGPASLVMEPLPDQVVVAAGLWVDQNVTVTAYDSYGNLALTTPSDTVGFNIDLQYPPGKSCTRLFCGIAVAGVQFTNSVASGPVSYVDPPGAVVTLSAYLSHNGMVTYSTSSQTTNYVQAAIDANAIVVPDITNPINYDLQITDPISSQVDLLAPTLTVTNAQQMSGTLELTLAGTSLITGQPVTLTVQATTAVDTTSLTLAPKVAPKVGDNITVSDFVLTQACQDSPASCSGVAANAPTVTFQPTATPHTSYLAHIFSFHTDTVGQ